MSLPIFYGPERHRLVCPLDRKSPLFVISPYRPPPIALCVDFFHLEWTAPMSADVESVDNDMTHNYVHVLALRTRVHTTRTCAHAHVEA